MIRLGKAGKMGRGVFATQFIPAYSEIMRCETIVLSDADIEHIKKTSISQHYFADREKRKDIGIFALGLVTMINHSKTPNVEIFTQKTANSYIAICQSLADISVKKQLFMDYGDDPNF